MDYYGDLPYSESLMHYGVKGMKWGVRKAIEKGSERALDRHWRKANRKLGRLNKKADWAYQHNQWKKGSGIAAGGMLGGAVGGIAAASESYRNLPLPKRRELLLAMGLSGAAGGSLPGTIKSVRANKRLHSEGHKQAVKNAHDWADEMNKAFDKTKYQGQAKKFKDEYIIKARKYDAREAKAGNAMPYINYYQLTTGDALAKQHDKVYPGMGRFKKKHKTNRV